MFTGLASLMKPVHFATTYYLSPTGNDITGDGSISSPWFTLNKAWTVVAAGDIVYMRGGQYDYTVQQYLTGVNGSSGNLIKVWNYPGELPVINKGSGYTNPSYFRGGTYFSGNYMHFKGIEIKGFTQPVGNTFVWSGLLVIDANDCIFENLNIHDNGHGMGLQGNTKRCLIKNSDFHHNYDQNTGGGNADGLQICFSTTITSADTTYVEGCRAWDNSDDNYDGYEFNGFIKYTNCWANKSGYIPYTNTTAGNGEGFKCGSTTISQDGVLIRSYTGCLAIYNRHDGWNQNGNLFKVKVDNCTAGKNVNVGINLSQGSQAHVWNNIVSFDNGNYQAFLSAESVITTSSYGLGTGSNGLGGPGSGNSGWTNNASTVDFINSSDSTGFSVNRKVGGELPDYKFLKPIPPSDLIDTGTPAGFDRGYSQYSPKAIYEKKRGVITFN